MKGDRDLDLAEGTPEADTYRIPGRCTNCGWIGAIRIGNAAVARSAEVGGVVYVNFGRDELSLTKKELAGAIGKSVRYVEAQTACGMPSTIRGRRRLYKETACRNWLAQQERIADAG